MRQERRERETPNESLDGSLPCQAQLNGLANLIRLGSELLLYHGIVRYILHILHWLIKGCFFVMRLSSGIVRQPVGGPSLEVLARQPSEVGGQASETLIIFNI